MRDNTTYAAMLKTLAQLEAPVWVRYHGGRTGAAHAARPRHRR